MHSERVEQKRKDALDSNNERTSSGASALPVGVKEARVIVRDDKTDDKYSNHVKEQDTEAVRS